MKRYNIIVYNQGTPQISANYRGVDAKIITVGDAQQLLKIMTREPPPTIIKDTPNSNMVFKI